MKITIEAEGYRLVIDDDDLESFGLSLPSDFQRNPDGTTEQFGHTHVSLTGVFKEGFRPAWEEIHE